MPVVPLGSAAYERVASIQPEIRLVNLFLEEDKSGASPDQIIRLQRPGLTRSASFQDRIRAIYQSDNTVSNVPIVVSGSKVIRTDDYASLGTVENDGDSARVVATFERVVIVSAGVCYSYDGSELITLRKRDNDQESDNNTLTDLEPIIDADVLNGYVVLVTSSGTFYWLVPGESTIGPLNYATAESLPDGCMALRRLRDDLYFFGSNSIEVWQATGDADAPFARASARLVDRGALARDTAQIYDNTLVWVGNDKIVYRLAEVPQRISTFGIEERLARADDLPSAWTFSSVGHKFFVLDIPGEGSFAYDAATQSWSEFVWSVRDGIDTATGAIAADSTGGLFALDPASPLDDGQPFQRIITGTVAIPPRPVANSSLALGVGCEAAATFHLRWFDHARGWSSPIRLDARAGDQIINAWRLGAARAPSRTFELSTISPALVRISGAVANEGWRV